MSSASASAMPPRFAVVKFSLFVLALLALLPVAAQAQSTFTGGAASVTTSSAATSTVTVTGATGSVKTVSVELDGVKSTGTCNPQGTVCFFSLQEAEFLLKAPNGDEFVLLSSTGDGEDGCDGSPNQSASCNGLQGTSGDIITITDSSSNDAPYDLPWLTTSMPYTVKPSSYYYNNFGDAPPLPGGDIAGDLPQTDGCSNPLGNPALNCSAQTMDGAFLDAGANGTWTLTLIDSDTPVDPFSITGWKLTLTYNAGGGPASTTTALSSNANPGTYANSASSGSATFTATVSTVSSGAPTGTVAFSANGTTISGCGTQTLSGSGNSSTATCNATGLAQGNNTISAVYTPNSGSFGQSNTTMTELMEVTPANPAGNQWCNNSVIADPLGGGTPLAYPSVIKINNAAYNSKSVANVVVDLNGVAGPVDGIGGEFLLVAPGGGTHNLDFLDQGFGDPGAINAVNLIFQDDSTTYVPNSTPQFQQPAITNPYLATDDNSNANPDTFPTSTSPTIDSSIPQVPGTINFAPPYGTGNTHYTHTGILTFGEAFNGVPANGSWSLYSISGETLNVNTGWCITLSLNTGNSTTTTLAPSSNPATKGTAVTFTATVTSGGNPVTSGGTVTFLDNDATPAGTTGGNNVVSLNGSGTATFTTSALSEGDHTITATYSGTSSDNESFSPILNQRIDDATASSAVNSNTWQYCNTGAVQIAQGTNSGPLTPNPSNIFVTHLPGTLNTASVTLNNFSVTTADDLDQLATLVEGPTGAALDFFSNTTQGSNGTSQASLGNYTFADSAASQVSSGNVNISPGTYKPTAYESFLSAPDSFTSSASGFYPAPSSFSYAPPNPLGTSATLAEVFTDGSNANGTWSLFFSSGYPNATFGAANGWCVNLTENLPSVTADASHNANFTQGQQGAQITAEVTNNGPGSTGDATGSNPMTVVDTLNAAFTYASASGTGWSCSPAGQTITCSNDSAVADGVGYPTLTLNVNVADGATGAISNSFTASGAGVASTNSNTDSITIVPAPVLGVSEGDSGTFTQGQTGGTLTVTVSNTAGGTSMTQGTTTVTETLPSGYSAASASFTTNGWSCSGTSTVICTSTQQVAGGSSYNVIDIPVSVPAAAPNPTTTNAATASGGGAFASGTSGTVSFPVVQVAASIVASGGGGQSTIANTAFASPLTVTVTDAASVPINNASVTFTAPGSGAGGTFSNSSNTITVNTGSNGIASSGTFTANATAGAYSVSAQATGLGSTAGFTLTNLALPAPTTMQISGGSTAYQGGAYSFTVTVLDQYSNTDTGYTGTVQFSSSDVAASLPANYTFTGGDAGVHTFTATLNTVGSQSITATDAANSLTATVSNIAVSVPNLVVTTASDDAGTAGNCTPQATPGQGTDGSCSLRDALLQAASIGSGNISFNASTFTGPQSITLSNGTLNIPSNTSISGPTQGAGAGLTNIVTVNGNAASTVFTVGSGVTNSSFSGLIVSSGSSASGGGISNAGTLSITASTISGNAASSAGQATGGGISNTGTLTLSSSTVSGNSVISTGGVQAGGGGIYNSGSLSLTLSTVSGNSATAAGNGGGAGIVNNGGTLALNSSTISANTADGAGGGLFINAGTVTLANTIITGNSASTSNDVSGSYTDNGGNVIVGAAVLAALNSYGGPTQTMVPQPGGAAICAGSLANANAEVISFDQRGYGFDPNCPAGSVDSGAVQTNYALTFTTPPPSSVVVGATFNPPPVVQLTENTQPATWAGNTVTLTDSASMLGGTTSVSLASSWATFNNINLTRVATNDTLTATLALTGSINLTASSQSTISSVGQTQTITFPPLPTPQPANATVTLAASSSAGLPILYSSATPSVCSLSGTTVTLLTEGTCIIQARQNGNGIYGVATMVQQEILVQLLTQTINFPAITLPQYALTNVTLTAAATSGLSISYTSVTPSICTVSGATASLLLPGQCIVHAAQSGNLTYASAPTVSVSFPVQRAQQTISFPAPTTPQLALTQTTLAATATSGLAISYSSSTPSVCTVSGSTASLLTPGACVVQATQAGNSLYSAAPPNTLSFTVSTAAQSITFTPVANQIAGSSVNLVATASSGLAVSFASLTPTMCTVAGSTASMLTAGECVIHATQGGNSFYSNAPTVSQDIFITAQSQTISFPAITATLSAASTLPLSATATSGLTVSFSSSTPAVCTVSGTTASLLTAGTCIVQATQSGSGAYAAAPTVQQNLAVHLATQTISFPAVRNQVIGANVTLLATATSGLTVVFTSATPSMCTVSGTTATMNAAGSCVIHATQAGNSTYAPAPLVSRQIIVTTN
ncbi:MAG: Ig-like domain repeat protein [Terracidiphilus sp.]|jgi:hypothetical protein